MAKPDVKGDTRRYVESSCEVLGEFWATGLDGFKDGSLVRIYLLGYGRMTTFDDSGNIYVVRNEEVGTRFVERGEWRSRQIKKIGI